MALKILQQFQAEEEEDIQEAWVNKLIFVLSYVLDSVFLNLCRNLHPSRPQPKPYT